jgi:hypothetical protein
MVYQAHPGVKRGEEPEWNSRFCIAHKSDGFIAPLFAMAACWKLMASEAKQSRRRPATAVCGMSLENWYELCTTALIGWI